MSNVRSSESSGPGSLIILPEQSPVFSLASPQLYGELLFHLVLLMVSVQLTWQYGLNFTVRAVRAPSPRSKQSGGPHPPEKQVA